MGTDQHAGLVLQANRNITGAQQGLPAPPEVIDDIVAFEESLSTAQLIVPSVGHLDSDGARGGPEALSAMSKVAGRFDLFDAWAGDENPRRAQIARGQEVFNTSGCGGCHNAANNGSNVDGRLFNIHASEVQHRLAGMPLYKMRNKATGETHETTDPGRALRSGNWADMDKFKVPSLRGVVARAPYFHNGIAANLDEVVRHYEMELGFAFDPQTGDREALIAFLEAL